MNFIRKLCISTICSALVSSSASAIIYEVRVNDSLNVRSEPSGSWVGSLSNGARVDVTEFRGNWGRISNGWICLDYATPISHPIQPSQYRVNVSDSLLFRSGPGQNNDMIGSFGNGTVLTINEVCGSWGKTTYNGRAGWICLDYTTPVQTQAFTPKQYIVNVSDCLRFRSSPTTDSSIIENLGNGTVLTIGEISNGWGKATHNNHSGWVCMDYMEEYHAPAPAPVSSQNKETANLQKEAAEKAKQETEALLKIEQDKVKEGNAIIEQKDKTIEEQKVLLAKLKKENEELKNQIEKLKAQNALLSENIKLEHEIGEAKCKEQEEKIAELKNQNKTLKDENDLLNKSVIEIEQLKQKIEEMCQK